MNEWCGSAWGIVHDKKRSHAHCVCSYCLWISMHTVQIPNYAFGMSQTGLCCKNMTSDLFVIYGECMKYTCTTLWTAPGYFHCPCKSVALRSKIEHITHHTTTHQNVLIALEMASHILQSQFCSCSFGSLTLHIDLHGSGLAFPHAIPSRTPDAVDVPGDIVQCQRFSLRNQVASLIVPLVAVDRRVSFSWAPQLNEGILKHRRFPGHNCDIDWGNYTKNKTKQIYCSYMTDHE